VSSLDEEGVGETGVDVDSEGLPELLSPGMMKVARMSPVVEMLSVSTATEVLESEAVVETSSVVGTFVVVGISAVVETSAVVVGAVTDGLVMLNIMRYPCSDSPESDVVSYVKLGT
jgi:hypothetical protein